MALRETEELMALFNLTLYVTAISNFCDVIFTCKEKESLLGEGLILCYSSRCGSAWWGRYCSRLKRCVGRSGHTKSTVTHFLQQAPTQGSTVFQCSTTGGGPSVHTHEPTGVASHLNHSRP